MKFRTATYMGFLIFVENRMAALPVFPGIIIENPFKTANCNLPTDFSIHLAKKWPKKSPSR
jgi:hypothetical protein